MKSLPNSSPLIGFEKKKPQYYKTIKMKTDTNLHEQIIYLIDNIICPSHKANILDLGCGEGALSQWLYDKGHNVLSVDVNKNNFKANGPNFYKLDLNDENQVNDFIKTHSTQKFDIILAIEVIEHLKNPWKFISNIKHLCNLDTHVLISTPNIGSWWARFMFLINGEPWGFSREAWIDPGHINPISKTEMESILMESGFNCLGIYSCGRLPIIWIYNWKRLLISLFILPFYIIMKGPKKGWALCYHATLSEKK